MPSIISPSEFVEETQDDFHSPTTSNFVEKMASCRKTVSSLEENLEYDREGLHKMKKAIKAIYNGGNDYVENGFLLSKTLEKLGANAMTKDSEPEIGSAFIKFSIVTKELSTLMKTLMQNMNNIVMFPLDNILKGELKGVKGDLKKPFERAWRDYENKITKIEKEKKAQAKEAGLIRTEISSAEIAEEMNKERKMFQLQMCEYLIKINDIKTKKGVELLQHLVDFYHAQTSYFQDGLKTIEHFNSYISDLSSKISLIKSNQDEEKRQLSDLRTLLRNSSPTLDCGPSTSSPKDQVTFGSSVPASLFSPGEAVSKKEKSAYNLHQLQGNKKFGFTKTGYLYKKPDKRMRMKQWQKRRCEIANGCFNIFHSDETKPPVQLNLLTCQVKPSPEDRRTFELICFARTYKLQAEDEFEAEAWISVLLNCNREALRREFDSNGQPLHEGLAQVRSSVISAVMRLPGNDRCVDCDGRHDLTWFSTNLGVLVCIECSGVHREMGVHVSRVQSLTLDNFGTSYLLIPAHVGNRMFNAVFEAALPEHEKITANCSMEKRAHFIRSKYAHRRYVRTTCDGSATNLQVHLEHALLSKNMQMLLQCFAEGAELSCILPSYQENGDTSLHVAISQEDHSSLHLVDFLVQNSRELNLQNCEGNTPLHICVLMEQSESMKLLLKAGANINVINAQGQTPLQLAIDLGKTYLVKLLEHSKTDEKSIFEYVNVHWNLNLDDASTDFSDEDHVDDKLLTKEYYDWLFNGSTSSIIETILAKQREPEVRNNIRKYSLSSFEPQNGANSMDKRKLASRPNSVIEPNEVIGLFHCSGGKKYEQRQQAASSAALEGKKNPPPVPPHQFKGLRGSCNIDAKLSKSHHTRTISDSGLRRISLNRKSNTLDSHCSSFIQKNRPGTIERVKLIEELRQRHQENSDNQEGSSHNESGSIFISYPNSLQRPKVPPIPLSNQTNRSVEITDSQELIKPHLSSVLRTHQTNRKHQIYVDSSKIRNGQSIESLPSLSSDELSNKYSPIPIPPPRKKSDISLGSYKRCQALYDCEADREDELAFKQGEIIVILNEKTEDDNWMEGAVEGEYNRKGVFPISFVQMLN